VSYVGYPHGLYLTWSDMKRAKVTPLPRRFINSVADASPDKTAQRAV
jgi:hypothetical protein